MEHMNTSAGKFLYSEQSTCTAIDLGTKGLHKSVRRRIMAALRKSSMCIAFGRTRSIGAMGVGTVAAALSMGLPGSATAQTAGPPLDLGTTSSSGSMQCSTNDTNVTDASLWLCTLPTGNGGTVTINGVATSPGQGTPDFTALRNYVNSPSVMGANAIMVGDQATRATGANAIAVGNGTQATGENSTAIGKGSVASAPDSVAIGREAKATGQNNLALGTNAQAMGGWATAIGNDSVANGNFGSAIAIGPNANAKGADNTTAIAIGEKATAVHAGVALGYGAQAPQDAAVAIGWGADATGSASGVVIGDRASAVGQNAIAIGGNVGATATKANGAGALALGSGANATGTGAVAFGGLGGTNGGSIANNDYAVAIGAAADAEGEGAVAIGGTGSSSKASAGGDNSLAIGGGAKTMAGTTGAIAVGANAQATASNSFAFGTGAIANTEGAMAYGENAKATAANSIAFGTDSAAAQAGAVALGSESVTASAVGTPSTTIAGTQYRFAGTTPQSTVSVGAQGKERTITNVAAGRISDSSTDAVNGSQLYATNQAAEDAILEAQGNTKALGGNAAYDPATNTYTAPTYTTSTGVYRDVGSALLASNAQINLLGSSVATGLGGGSSYNQQTGQVTTLLNVGGNDYSNVNDAINAVNTTASAGWNFTTAATGTGVVSGTTVANVAPNGTHTITAGDNIVATQNGTGVQLAVNPNLKITSVTTGNTVMNTNGLTIGAAGPTQVSLTGSGLNNGGNKITNIAAGTDDSDAVNYGQLKDTISGAVAGVNIGFAGNEGTAVKIASGGTLAIKGAATTAGSYSGANIKTVTDTATGAVNIQMAESPKFGDVTINDGGTGKITGVAAATLSDTSKDAVNGSQLVALGNSVASSLGGTSSYNPNTNTINTQIAFGGAVYNSVQGAFDAVSTGLGGGWNVTTGAVGSGIATNTTTTAVKPGETMQITAGNNIMVNQNGKEVQVALNPNLKDIESIQIAGGPTINGNGVNMNGDRITNVGNAIDPGDAVNLGQMQAGMASTLASANTYTDNAVGALRVDLAEVRRDANGGTASAMAMSQVPQAFEPGMGIVGMGVSTWQGEQAVAIGFSKASDSGRVILKASGTYNTRQQAGAAVGVGFQF